MPSRARQLHDATADVMVLDANLRASLLCVRSLGRAGLRVAVVACASRAPAPAYASRWASVVRTVPDVDRDEDGYVDAVLAVARETRARVLVPTGDASVAALRRRRPEVEEVVALALPAERTLDVLVSKSRTLELARSLDLAVPRGVLVGAGRTADPVAQVVGLPAVVKPVESFVRRGDRPSVRLQCQDAADAEELQALIDEVTREGGTALVQEWVPGRREAVHVFAEQGRVVALAAQVNERTHPPLGGDTVLRRTISAPEDTASAACALAEATGLHGYAEVEFRRDLAGGPVLMEVNPRMSASAEVAVRAGADFPVMMWRQAVGLPVAPVADCRPGVRLRWLGGDLRWLVSSVRERHRPHRTPPARALAGVLAESVRGTGCDYLGWRDLGPAGAALVGLASRTRAAGAVSGTRHRGLSMSSTSA